MKAERTGPTLFPIAPENAPEGAPSPTAQDAPRTVPVLGERGIAALASRGRQLDARNATTYTELPSRSLLNRAVSRKALPFTWTINPYRGCEIGCVYCYARYTHEYLGFADPMDFERRIYVKDDVAATLERDLQSRRPAAGETIAIGTATDPYQPAERRFQRTRAILEVFARHEGLSLSLTTKQELVLRDTDLLCRIRDRHRLTVNISLITSQHRLARQLDPRASTPEARLRILERLNGAGIRTCLFLMPVIPGVTDDANDLERLIRLAAAAGTPSMAHQTLFLRDCIRKRFFPFLEERSPRLLRAYRRSYSREGEAPEDYRERIGGLIRELAEKYGINGARSTDACEAFAPAVWSQGSLFERIPRRRSAA